MPAICHDMNCADHEGGQDYDFICNCIRYSKLFSHSERLVKGQITLHLIKSSFRLEGHSAYLSICHNLSCWTDILKATFPFSVFSGKFLHRTVIISHWSHFRLFCLGTGRGNRFQDFFLVSTDSKISYSKYRFQDFLLKVQTLGRF